MWAFREWERYVYKNKSKQIFIPFYPPDMEGRRGGMRRGRILYLEAANSMQIVGTGRENIHYFFLRIFYCS